MIIIIIISKYLLHLFPRHICFRRPDAALGPLRSISSVFLNAMASQPESWSYFTHQYSPWTAFVFCFELVIGRYEAFQRSGAPVRLDVGEASKDMEYSDQVRKDLRCHILFALLRSFPVPHFCTGQHHSQTNHSVCPAPPIGCTDTS
jgi:hypothetical protein